MPQSKGPLTTVSLGESPVYCAFAVFQIVLVLSEVVLHTGMPIELPYSVHLAVFPLSIVAFTIKPGVLSIAIELIFLKFAYVLLFEFCPTAVLQHELGVFGERNPFQLLCGSLPG